MKEILRRNKPRTKAEFHTALSAALFAMNDEDFEEWYEACGYLVGLLSIRSLMGPPISTLMEPLKVAK